MAEYGVLILLALLAYDVVLSLVLWRRIRRERKRAEQQTEGLHSPRLPATRHI